ncbi:MAG: DNA repair exonuclease [Deltaproteobacteria bacterium]|nr:DNA repair exonuclease [Deltaproteobacteria bacterium]
MDLRLLLLADTHLGLDAPRRPRVERPRRGPDFFANYRSALAPARRGEVDLVVHGGDLFFRSKIPPSLTRLAFEPLFEVADAGVPVFVVPGNHERGAIPHPLLALHPGVTIFDRPATHTLEVRGRRVALVGFPFARAIRARFPGLLAATGWRDVEADLRLLCLHQAVEGARVGPVDYTFRGGEEVLPGRAIPRGFAAVLCGHIHRHQILRRDLAGRPLAAPVLYPGSIERTAFAEAAETKGYLLLELDEGGLRRQRFVPLPARPMVEGRLSLEGERETVEARLRELLGALPPRALCRLVPEGALTPTLAGLLSAASLRALAPPGASVELRPPGASPQRKRRASRPRVVV